MNISDVRGKSIDELNDLLLSLKKEAMNIRFQKVSGELEKTSRIRLVRKDIARVNTVLAELSNKGAAHA